MAVKTMQTRDMAKKYFQETFHHFSRLILQTARPATRMAEVGGHDSHHRLGQAEGGDGAFGVQAHELGEGPKDGHGEGGQAG